MSRFLFGLLFLAALRSAAAQEMNFPASCAAADSLLGAATARQLRAPLQQMMMWPDSSLVARTGTHMMSASGIAISARWQAGGEGPVEIQIELSLRAERVREYLLAQDSLLILVDDRPALSLGVPATARIESAFVVNLPLLAPLSMSTLLDLTRARSVSLRIGATEVPFTTSDRNSAIRLARVLVCAGLAA